MFNPVQFEPEVERLVRFVEEADPECIVEQTIEKLRAGTSSMAMITASALAIVRSTDLPPNHHGGPLHPVCGIRAVANISKRLSGELSYLPIIQHTALCNNHTHSPQMGPYLMPELEPMTGAVGDVGSYHVSDHVLHDDATGTADDTTELASTRAAFHRCLLTHNAIAAEHYFLWLLEDLAHGEVIDELLPLAIARNNMDDHHFIYPVYTARALDEIGWQWSKILFRPAVRYQARHQSHLVPQFSYEFEKIECLVDEYRLLARQIPLCSDISENTAIASLGEAMGENRNYFDNVELMAKALADGLSIQGAGEALSIGSALAYLSTSYGNPMDSHLHTGTNNRRYLLNKNGISQKNRVMALLTGFTGPEVLLAESLHNWESNLGEGITDALPKLEQSALLQAITESIEGQPWLDWRAIGVDHVVAPDSVKETIALARQYAELGYCPELYFQTLAEFSCRDDFTEMHSLKHFQAIVDEYYTTQESFRWVHMVSAAKSAAVVHVGREHSIYNRANQILRH